MGLIEHTLKKPIEDMGDKVTIVTLKEPTVDDLIVMDKHTGEMSKTRALIARLSGLSEKGVGSMSIPDFKSLTDLLQPFLE